MRIFCLIFFSAVASVFSGCSLFDHPAATTIGELAPLGSGNYWQYDMQAFNDSGIQISILTETTAITGTEAGAPNEYDVDFGNGHTGIWLENNTDLSIISDTTSSIFFPDPIPMIRYPMNPGQTLPLTVGTTAQGYNFQKFLTFHGSNQSVTVPEGTFSCYHFEVVTSIDTSKGYQVSRTQDSYYAVNVGLVEEVYYTVVNGVKKIFLSNQLRSYRVGGK